jgi:hypothetical protein
VFDWKRIVAIGPDERLTAAASIRPAGVPYNAILGVASIDRYDLGTYFDWYRLGDDDRADGGHSAGRHRRGSDHFNSLLLIRS